VHEAPTETRPARIPTIEPASLIGIAERSWEAMKALIRTGGMVALCLALAGPVVAQPGSVQEDVKYAKSLSRAFNHAAELISPSVVQVTNIGTMTYQDGFFGPLRTKNDVPKGAGSGVIVSKDGYILTNNHVVTGSEKVRVKLQDQRELDGKVVGVDPQTDLAVIKVSAGQSPARAVRRLRGPGGRRMGAGRREPLRAVRQLRHRRHRLRQGAQADRATDENNEDFIQTDAAINPGNSAGPWSTWTARSSASTPRSPRAAAATRGSVSRSRRPSRGW
jgi:S1-C subfamily serine protease